nr:hypothetical protein [Tanacetum cinerariifolium]
MTRLQDDVKRLCSIDDSKKFKITFISVYPSFLYLVLHYLMYEIRYPIFYNSSPLGLSSLVVSWVMDEAEADGRPLRVSSETLMGGLEKSVRTGFWEPAWFICSISMDDDASSSNSPDAVENSLTQSLKNPDGVASIHDAISTFCPDESGFSVNDTLFRGMIRELMYLIASRPDI